MSTCRECGRAVDQESGQGLCPVCLFHLAVEAADEETAPQAGGGGDWEGREIGRYQIRERIGRGGMGVVYKAFHRDLRCFVALKLIRSGALASERELRRFRMEAQAASKLRHPNIVPVYDVGEHDGEHFFTMEYVEGTNLAEKVRENSLPPKTAARYVATVARAVAHAHREGVYHRDLKPANVLIDAEDRPRLTDFGLAKVVEASDDPTLSGSPMGTPCYMSPEQATGARGTLGAATDVYSLGAILYDLLTGRPPFRAETPLETLRQVVDMDPAAPRLLNRGVPRDLETICLKCLSKNPGSRYPSAAALADDLERYLRQEPIQARPAGSLKRVWRWAQRHPGVAALTLAQSLLLLSMSWAAYESRRMVIEGNLDVSRAVAKDLKDELDGLCVAVTSEARNPALVNLLETPDSAERKDSLVETCKELNDRYGVDFENWALIDANGQTLARYPAPTREPRSDRSDRDYFQWPMQSAERGEAFALTSPIYESDEDGLLKLGISCAITNVDGKVLGVIAGMVAGDRLAALNSDDSRGAVWQWEDTTTVAGRFDGHSTNTTLKAAHALFLHLGRGNTNKTLVRALGIQHPDVERLLSTNGSPEWGSDTLYRDPHPESGGLWTAVFVRVEGHPLVVIYQKRNPIATVLIVVVSAASIITLGFWLGIAARRTTGRAR